MSSSTSWRLATQLLEPVIHRIRTVIKGDDSYA